jgi:hypothetical protein
MTESRYTPELADALLHRVSEGSSLSEACRAEGIPESTARQWARDNRCGFGAAYQQARMLQLEAWSDRIVDTGQRTDIEATDKRVICDSYKWILSKLGPERYGERLPAGSDRDHLNDLSPGALNALERFMLHVIDSRTVEVNGMLLLEHDHVAASTQHDVVERPAASLEVSQ